MDRRSCDLATMLEAVEDVEWRSAGPFASVDDALDVSIHVRGIPEAYLTVGAARQPYLLSRTRWEAARDLSAQDPSTLARLYLFQSERDAIEMRDRRENCVL